MTCPYHNSISSESVVELLGGLGAGHVGGQADEAALYKSPPSSAKRSRRWT
jgi:hypothetical protein